MKYFYDKITQEMKDDMESFKIKNVLFCGKQGSGKTIAARKLEKELKVPIEVVEVEDRYLGRAIIFDKPNRELYTNREAKKFEGVRIYITNFKQIRDNLDKFDLIVKG
jgi:AAA+ superfamily predicted ATPase